MRLRTNGNSIGSRKMTCAIAMTALIGTCSPSFAEEANSATGPGSRSAYPCIATWPGLRSAYPCIADNSFWNGIKTLLRKKGAPIDRKSFQTTFGIQMTEMAPGFAGPNDSETRGFSFNWNEMEVRVEEKSDHCRSVIGSSGRGSLLITQWRRGMDRVGPCIDRISATPDLVSLGWEWHPQPEPPPGHSNYELNGMGLPKMLVENFSSGRSTIQFFYEGGNPSCLDRLVIDISTSNSP